MAIDADVDLFHNESAKPSELVMTTANAWVLIFWLLFIPQYIKCFVVTFRPLNARVSLTTASGYTGEFGVDVQTANAPLTLTYVNSPVYSQLYSEARTTNAPVTLHLYDAVEDSFVSISCLDRIEWSFRHTKCVKVTWLHRVAGDIFQPWALFVGLGPNIVEASPALLCSSIHNSITCKVDPVKL